MQTSNSMVQRRNFKKFSLVPNHMFIIHISGPPHFSMCIAQTLRHTGSVFSTETKRKPERHRENAYYDVCNCDTVYRGFYELAAERFPFVSYSQGNSSVQQ